VHADEEEEGGLKKKGDCIAVQPLDHRTTQHDYEQKGGKNKTPSNVWSKALPIILVSHKQGTKKHAPRTVTIVLPFSH
jgi:hypothetical protein